MPTLGGPYSTRMQFYRADRLNFNDTNVIFTGTATTDANGIATLYFTTDGTANGASLFTSVDTAHVNVVSNAAQAINVPVTEIREINLEGKYVSASGRTLIQLFVPLLGLSVVTGVSFTANIMVRFTVFGRYET